MINNAPTINRTKLCMFLRNVKKHIDYYSTLSEEQKNNSLKKAIVHSYTKEESSSQLGYHKRWLRPIPLNEESLQLLPKDLLKNIHIAKKIIENNPTLYQFLDTNLKLEGELITFFFDNIKDETTKKIIIDNIDSYLPGFLTDKELCLNVSKIAIKSPRMAHDFIYSLLPMIPVSIKADQDFIQQLLHEDHAFYNYIEPQLQEDFQTMIDSMKTTHGQVFCYFPPDLRSDLFFSHYMSKFGEIDGNYLSGDLKEQYLKTNGASTNSFLNALVLKEKLDNKLIYKSSTQEKTKKI